MTINRDDRSVAVDRMDRNIAHKEPFIGRRDFFYHETRPDCKEQLAFVRHDYWRFKLDVFGAQLWSNVDAAMYKSCFKK